MYATNSFTGTSISTPTTVANAAPDQGPILAKVALNDSILVPALVADAGVLQYLQAKRVGLLICTRAATGGESLAAVLCEIGQHRVHAIELATGRKSGLARHHLRAKNFQPRGLGERRKGFNDSY